MIGIALIAVSEFLSEISISFGKYQVAHKKESMYAIGFMNSSWAMLFIFLWTLFVSHDFHFSIQSLPTFSIRAVFEIILMLVNLNAVCNSNRSTFAYLHTITIPLLLIIDIFLGISIEAHQIIGMAIILVSIIFISVNHGLDSKGKFLCFMSSVIGVINVSLYKYNITHYNSVASEQIAMTIIVLIALWIIAKWRLNENLFLYFKQPILLKQSILAGIAGSMISFAYLFAPASIIMTGRRSFDVIYAVISGKIYFHEIHVAVKIVGVIGMIIGLMLLV